MSRPAAIALDRAQQTLTITWKDGHVSVYPLNVLREACPCVECRGGHENMGKKPDMEQLLGGGLLIPLARAKSYLIDTILPVGNYAIQPQWTDGHNTGIYTWIFLRDICPCSECRAQAKEQPLYRPIE